MFRNSRPGNRSAKSLASSLGVGGFFCAAAPGAANEGADSTITAATFANSFTTPPLERILLFRNGGVYRVGIRSRRSGGQGPFLSGPEHRPVIRSEGGNCRCT